MFHVCCGLCDSIEICRFCTRGYNDRSIFVPGYNLGYKTVPGYNLGYKIVPHDSRDRVNFVLAGWRGYIFVPAGRRGYIFVPAGWRGYKNVPRYNDRVSGGYKIERYRQRVKRLNVRTPNSIFKAIDE